MIGLGILAMTAGILNIGVAVSKKGKNYSVFLFLNGMMYCLLCASFIIGIYKPITFVDIALVIFPMAISLGMYLYLTVSSQQGQIQSTIQIIVGIAFYGSAFCFFAVIKGWIHLDPAKPMQSFYLLGSYFLFSALCKYFPIYRMALQMRAAQSATLQPTPST